jgi:Tfp pilus assembly protein PilZ
MASEPQHGKYDLTARLFKLISQMPRDQQLILLKQLVGDNVATHLFKLIVDMTEEQQIILMDQMGQMPQFDEPVKTLSLDESGPTMRENPRRTCLINANYRIKDRKYRSYILDISVGGVFVETEKAFPVGQPITLLFTIPQNDSPLSLQGRVAWSGPQGFGVQFRSIRPKQDKAIRSFVSNQDR